MQRVRNGPGELAQKSGELELDPGELTVSTGKCVLDAGELVNSFGKSIINFRELFDDAGEFSDILGVLILHWKYSLALGKNK